MMGGQGPGILVVLGAPATGKCTVALAIAQRTAHAVLHNHMTIDSVTEFFDTGRRSTSGSTMTSASGF